MKTFALCLLAAAALTACDGLASKPTGPDVRLSCSEDAKGQVIVATNNCDKSTRTAEPFIVEPVIVETPAAE